MLSKISNRKKIWCGILAAELLLLLLYGLKLERRQTAEIDLTQDELLYDTDESGFYLDTSFEGRSIKTPDLTLQKGLYRLEAEIECAGDHILEIRYKDEQLRYDMSGEILFSDSGVISYDFEVKYDDRPFQVWGKLGTNAEEGQYILIRNLKIAPSPFAVRFYLFRLLLILAVADFFVLLYTLRDRFQISRETGDHLKILVLLIVVSSIPLMVNYVFSSDLLFHLTRIEGIKTGLQKGMFPVKIQPNWLNGHGYAASVFYGDLFLYVPAVLRLLGLSLQASYQIYVLLVNTATVFVAYYCFTKMSSGRIGLVCTIVYSLNIYRLVCIYSRGALGEYTAMIFLPIVLYGMWRIYMLPEEEKEHGTSWLTLTIGCSGIFLCHMISTEIVGFFLIVTALILWKRTFRKKTLLTLAKAAAATVLLNLWFLVPFLDYMCNGSYLINGSDLYQPYQMEEKGAALAQLFMLPYSAYGVYGAGRGVKGEMPHTVGLAAILALAGWLFLCVGRKEREKEERRQEYLAVFLSVLSLFMATHLFPYTWLAQKLPFLKMPVGSIQFPWRFFTFAGIALVYLLCLLLKKEWIAKRTRTLFAIAVVCLSLWQSVTYLSECLNFYGPSRVYQAENLTTFNVGNGEYLPHDEGEAFQYETWLAAFQNTLTYDESAVSVEDWRRSKDGVEVRLTNRSEDMVSVEVPLLLYKGYHGVAENGEELALAPGKSHRIAVAVPGGFDGTIRVFFAEPWYWRVCEVMSVLTAVCIVLLLVRKKHVTRQGETGIAENKN
ncbi:MAG: hypothetical protein NC302_03545 [Bacteroidales bacterium]|nr:hypothetical protein [Bacteroidales bacterium]MCM1416589.1 hypothetical protein [bacterium]MCM1422857.1 hypothetical protein [bacterium]